MATLYRKYRPQNFKEVVGQNHIKITLEHEIKSGRIAHAYLFCGPRAVGKTTLARVMAKAINCMNKKDNSAQPCSNCDPCKDITAGRALDVIEIDAASHTGVDNVRENVIANARVAPSKYKYKVFIIDEVHMLSISAFNALLKVIEEPPEYVVFILCTTEIHKVPTTIISRCQRFDFRRISVTDIVKKLNYIIREEKIKINKTILEAIARQSEGHMRDAESMLGQIVAIGGKEITQEEADLVIPRSDLTEAINLVENLANKDAPRSIKLINKLIDEGVDLKVFFSDFIEILRKMLLAKISPDLNKNLGLELGESLEIKLNKIKLDLSIEQLLKYIERFILARNELKGSFIIQLPFELAIAELCSLPAQTPAVSTVGTGKTSLDSTSTVKSNFIDKSISRPANEEKPAPVSSRVKIGQEQVLDRWSEVLAKIKQYNHSLSFILRVCQPRDLAGNKLCLAFKYKFHKDRVSEPNIKAAVERVLQQVYSMPITIEALIDEDLVVTEKQIDDYKQDTKIKKAESKKEEKNDMVDNLLKTFGGKVIK